MEAQHLCFKELRCPPSAFPPALRIFLPWPPTRRPLLQLDVCKRVADVCVLFDFMVHCQILCSHFLLAISLAQLLRSVANCHGCAHFAVCDLQAVLLALVSVCSDTLPLVLSE